MSNKVSKVLKKQKTAQKKENNLKKIYQEISDLLKDISVTEFVRQAKVKANVFPVKEEGDRIVLLQPKEMRDCALLLFDAFQTSTQWQMRFALVPGLKTRKYSLSCGCCKNHRYGLKCDYKDDTPEYREWDNKLRDIYWNSIERIAKQKKINKIYVRKAYSWYEKYGLEKDSPIHLIEADEIAQSLKYIYTKEKIIKAWDFVDWEGTSFKLLV